MNLERMPWLRFLSRSAVLCAMIFGTVRLALARDGVSGGAPRSFLTVSGVLTGVSGTPMATFRFSHGGATTGDGGVGGVLCAPTVPIADIDPTTHAFSVEVPLDQPGQECPAALFDGSDAFVEVAIGATTVVARRAINPVPYANYAHQYGTPDCPARYSRTTDAATPTGSWFCRNEASDDVVRVGNGHAAFWIDRYEATVWTTPLGPADRGVRWFDSENDFNAARFPRSGQWRQVALTLAAPAPPAPPVYALSIAGSALLPARWISWFQAAEACRASGKRLPTNEEWQAAAQGTDDPGMNNGDGGRCRTNASGPRNTGGGTLCRSGWGAQDMVGNVFEMTETWMGSIDSNSDVDAGIASSTWPTEFGGDLIFGVVSRSAEVFPGPPSVANRPAAVFRGGAFHVGNRAGVLMFGAGISPLYADPYIGFRCVIPR